jgi:hypothetical protein
VNAPTSEIAPSATKTPRQVSTSTAVNRATRSGAATLPKLLNAMYALSTRTRAGGG